MKISAEIRKRHIYFWNYWDTILNYLEVRCCVPLTHIIIKKQKRYIRSITCEAQTLGNLIDTFSKDVKKISLMAVLIIFFIIYIGMGRKNPFFAFLSLVPIGFGILGLMGTHRWLGADLNLISIALIPLILGIGIDDGIHIVHRYLENNPRSIAKVMQSTGKAIFFTTATTCIAFGSLIG
jgi:predicted RND superfamily exporter protein